MFMSTRLKTIDTKPFEKVTNSEFMFAGCKYLEKIDTKPFKNTKNIFRMFAEVPSMYNINKKDFKSVDFNTYGGEWRDMNRGPNETHHYSVA